MKKVIFAACLGFFFVSCKKDYTCVCRINGFEVSSTTINDTKSKAKDKCNEDDGTTTIDGFGEITLDCEIQ